jgi:hypothetical protein
MTKSKTICSLLVFSLTVGIGFAETFTGTTRIVPQTWVHSTTGLTTVREVLPSSIFSWSHTSGTGANQMDQLWHGAVTMTASGTNTLDLTGGVTNSFGTVLTMAEVRLMVFTTAISNEDTVSIGGGPTAFYSFMNSTNDLLTIRPEGAIMFVAPDATGYAIGGGLLKFVNNSGVSNATVNVYIGASSS